MKRLLVLLSVLLGATTSIHADVGDYVLGIEYQEIIPAQQTQAPPGKVEVVEVFWYGCPHCYNTEPHVKNWLKAKAPYIHFVRLPSPRYNDQPGKPNLWKLHARAYYTAEALSSRYPGLLEKMHPAFFDEYHKKRNKLDSEDKLAAFFLKFGVSREEFLKVFNKSPRIKLKVAHARGMIQRYSAGSVPTFVINGKYRTNQTMAGSRQAMFDVINALAASEADKAKANAAK